MNRKDVSYRALDALTSVARNSGFSVEPLFEGLPFGPEIVGKKGVSFEWNVFVRLMANYTRMVGGDDVTEKMAEYGPRAAGNRWFSQTMGLFADPETLYKSVVKWFVPSVFPVVSARFEKLGDGRMRISMSLPEDCDPCPAYFRMWTGSLRSGPCTIGLGPSLVEPKYGERSAVFVITPPASGTLTSRLQRGWRAFFGARSALEQLTQQAAELREVYEQQLEMDVKLQISGQMAALAKMSALGEMAGGIAHEINNPLAIASMRVQLLRKMTAGGTLDAAQLDRDCQAIEEAVHRISRIVKGLRAFARDADKDPFEEIAVGKIVDDTFDLCSEKLKTTAVRLERGEIPRDLSIQCRATQITQVLLNLINNSFDAVESLPEKWIRVEVKDLGDQAQLSVVDAGRGIPESAQDRLFQPFFTTKSVGKGTGLGLSISKGLIESHQGKIFADRDASNTRFTVLLPKTQRVS